MQITKGAISHYVIQKNGDVVNGKPLYKKVGNELLYLAYTNVSGYETLWTMWGGSIDPDQVRIGNVKIGPKGIQCPEQQQVMFCYNFFTK